MGKDWSKKNFERLWRKKIILFNWTFRRTISNKNIKTKNRINLENLFDLKDKIEIENVKQSLNQYVNNSSK